MGDGRLEKKSNLSAFRLLWDEQTQAQEVAPEVAAINRCEAVALRWCVRGDQEIRDKMLTRRFFGGRSASPRRVSRTCQLDLLP